jgi:trehalose 6-phosphate synthase
MAAPRRASSTGSMPSFITPSDRQIIVLSSREPYRHDRDGDGIRVTRSSSGVVNAVEPLLLENGGVWVAEGVTVADRDTAQQRNGLAVPPGAARYRLRRVWLSKVERQGYYDGFANGALWPLCHRTQVEPVFYATDFGHYELANRRFADAVIEESSGATPVILVQDYHFALAPAMIRRQLPLGRIAAFWHIPWPKRETFEICPWSHVLLDGLLGSNVIGFQTSLDRDNFLRCAERLPNADVDRDDHVVHYRGRDVRTAVYPASVQWPSDLARAGSIIDCRADIRQRLGVPADTVLGVGVDRMDYTKGLEQKLLAVERLLENRPDLVGRFVFAQVAEPTRETIAAYRHTRQRVVAAADRINARFGATPTQPVRLLHDHHSHEEVARLLRAADLCYVGSLHDGMNLVSKEFVAARDDEHGVLVLSAFAGASHQLKNALIVNPYDIELVARTLGAAIDMPWSQQRARMRKMRRVLAVAHAGVWARRLVGDTCAEVLRRGAQRHQRREKVVGELRVGAS